MSEELEQQTIPRRTIASGTAWAVPVLGAAVAAPMAAASVVTTTTTTPPPPCLRFSFTSASSRCTAGGPGADYILTFCITSTCPPGGPTGNVTLRLSQGVTNESGEPLVPYPGCSPYADVTIPILASGVPSCTTASYRFSSTGSAANNINFVFKLNNGPDTPGSAPAPITCTGGRFSPPLACPPPAPAAAEQSAEGIAEQPSEPASRASDTTPAPDPSLEESEVVNPAPVEADAGNTGDAAPTSPEGEPEPVPGDE